jgi:hypothetical protein
MSVQDVIIGNFRADNPWYGNTWFEALDSDIYAAEDISDNPVTIKGVTYTGAYYRASTTIGHKSRLVATKRQLDFGGEGRQLTYGKSYFPKSQEFAWKIEPFKNFNANTPLANVRFSGSDKKGMIWDFVSSFVGGDYTMPAEN